MAQEILPIGTGRADSADVVVAPGEQLTVCLKGAGGAVPMGAAVSITLKGDDDIYYTVDALSSETKTAVVIIGAGTYRFTRYSGAAVGLFSA